MSQAHRAPRRAESDDQSGRRKRARLIVGVLCGTFLLACGVVLIGGASNGGPADPADAEGPRTSAPIGAADPRLEPEPDSGSGPAEVRSPGPVSARPLAPTARAARTSAPTPVRTGPRTYAPTPTRSVTRSSAPTPRRSTTPARPPSTPTQPPVTTSAPPTPPPASPTGHVPPGRTKNPHGHGKGQKG